MKENTIGVMDSGLGGLTTVKELKRLLPSESITYFGDTERSPYGILTPNTITKYSAQIAAYLVEQHIKILVIACGTTSGVAGDTLRKFCPVPVFDVIQPSCEKAVAVTQNKKIGIIGTSTTIKKGMYETYLRNIMPDAELSSMACQAFVDLVETGHFNPEDWKVKSTIEKYLYELKYKGIDTLVLGCTHFPVLAPAISKFMGHHVNLISSGSSVAQAAAKYLTENNMLSTDSEIVDRYFTTGSVDIFESLGGVVLGENIQGKTESVKKSYLDENFSFKKISLINQD